MALSKATISGSYRDATDVAGLTEMKAVFILSGIDTESAAAVVPTEVVALLVDGALPAGFALWKNTAGLRGTFYRHFLRGKRESRPGFADVVEVPLPNVQVGPLASYTLTALLNNPVPDAPGWNVNLDPESWDELQAQFAAAEAARVAAEAARDAALAVCVPVSQFGLMGDGSYEDDALEAALASNLSIEFAPNKTYRYNRKIPLRNKSGKVIKLNGAKILRGPDGRGGVHWITSSGIRILGGGGKLVGNRDTAGPWRSHFTTTGITDGDGTGTAGASYTTGHTGPIKIEGLGVGYVKKGDSFTYVRLGVTYRHIVQADVGIAGGIANVVLDRALEAPITAGQQLFVNMWTRRMVVSEDAPMGATTITLECADVTSADGNPRLLPGDVFSPHLNYNDVTQIDYSMVCEVLLGGPVVGAYPARKVTVTLKQPLSRALKKGEMVSSIQDAANQEEMLWGFSGCDDCSADDLEISNARVHGIGSAVIRAPWDGADPATRKNTRMRYSNIRDASSDGLGGALTLAWHEDFLVQAPRATLALGSLRSLLVIERSVRGQVLSPAIYGGQYCITINGECSQISILDMQAANAMRAFRQANTCSYIALFGGQVQTHASWSDYAALILANAFDDDNVVSVGASVRNHTTIDGLTCIGPTRTSGVLPGTGSHIMVLPQAGVAPEAVRLRDIASSGASAHGVYLGDGVDCQVSGVIEKSALSGFKGAGGSGNRLDRLEVQEAGLGWAGGSAPKIPGIELVGGTDWGLTGLRTKPGTSAGMGQGLAISGGATIREWSDNRFEGVDLSGGASLVAFASLADAEAAHGYGWRAANGQVWSAGALMFVGSTGAVALPSLPGSLPYGVASPAHAAAVGDGVADDRDAHQAVQNATPAGQAVLLTDPAFLGSAMGEGGKFLLRYTLGPIDWPDTLSPQRAMPGIVSGAAAAGSAVVFNMKRNTPETGGLMLISLRTEPSNSPENFQTNALQVAITCNDPSEPDPMGGEYLIRRGNVALMPRAVIAPGNMTGAIWSLNPFATVSFGSEGSACGSEINVANYGAVVTDFGAAFPKIGLQIVPYGNALTAGALLTPGNADGFARGFVVRHNALSAAYGISAFEYESHWRVDKAGDQYLGKGTGAETEAGIALKQSGDVVLTKSAGIVSLKAVRAGAMGAAGSVLNLDADAQSGAGTQRNMGRIQVYVSDPSDGAENAEVRIYARRAGATNQQAAIGAGMTVGGAALAMPGAGNLTVAGFVKHGSFTVATVPSASIAGAGAEIWVSNESGGPTLAMSDGTNWRRSHDRAVIS